MKNKPDRQPRDPLFGIATFNKLVLYFFEKKPSSEKRTIREIYPWQFVIGLCVGLGLPLAGIVGINWLHEQSVDLFKEYISIISNSSYAIPLFAMVISFIFSEDFLKTVRNYGPEARRGSFMEASLVGEFEGRAIFAIGASVGGAIALILALNKVV